MNQSLPFIEVVKATQGHGSPLEWVVTDAAEPAGEFVPVGMGYLHADHGSKPLTVRERLQAAAQFPLDFRIVEPRGAELVTIANGICANPLGLHYTAWTHPLRAVRQLYSRPGAAMQYRNRGDQSWRNI